MYLQVYTEQKREDKTIDGNPATSFVLSPIWIAILPAPKSVVQLTLSSLMCAWSTSRCFKKKSAALYNLIYDKKKYLKTIFFLLKYYFILRFDNNAILKKNVDLFLIKNFPLMDCINEMLIQPFISDPLMPNVLLIVQNIFSISIFLPLYILKNYLQLII